MITLRDRVAGKSGDNTANWAFFAELFDQFLRDYPSSPDFIKGKTNEEIGISMKVVCDIRKKIAESSAPDIQPPQSKIKKLKSITITPHE